MYSFMFPEAGRLTGTRRHHDCLDSSHFTTYRTMMRRRRRMKMDPQSHLQTAALLGHLCRETAATSEATQLTSVTSFSSGCRQLCPKLLPQKVALKSFIASWGQERVQTPDGAKRATTLRSSDFSDTETKAAESSFGPIFHVSVSYLIKSRWKLMN